MKKFDEFATNSEMIAEIMKNSKAIEEANRPKKEEQKEKLDAVQAQLIRFAAERRIR